MISPWQFFKKIVASSSSARFWELVWSLGKILLILGLQTSFSYCTMLKAYICKVKETQFKRGQVDSPELPEPPGNHGNDGKFHKSYKMLTQI